LGTTFNKVFTQFTAVNNFPELAYEEGAAYAAAAGYPPVQTIKITRSKPLAGGSPELDHLTSLNVFFKPGKGVSSSAKLKFKLDLPASETGPGATVQVLTSSGAIQYIPVVLDGSGDASFKVKFGRGKVDGVLITLTNASTRVTNCFQGSLGNQLSCHGDPLDDATPYKVKASLIQ
jgi:hypothetical protein